MWRLVGNPKTMKVTANLAKEFAEMEAAIHDRPLSERRLQVYERIIRSGGFRPVSWAKAYCKETGQTYRVNGKHTSTLMKGLADADDLPELYAVVEVYECDGLDDIAKLYATYDSRIQSRTASDINMSFASCIPQLKDVAPRIINLSVAAISFAEHRGDYGNVQPADRAEKLLDGFDFTLWLSELIASTNKNGANNNHLRRIPVCGAMKLNYDKSKRSATEFWSAVRDDTDPQPNMPTRKLSRFLLTNAAVGAHKDRRNRFIRSNKEFFVKSLHAWNAWRLGETTNLNYFANASIPDVK
jgi:hypothetical protein